MAVTTTNLIQGAADLYVGAFGATEPAETAVAIVTPPTTGWTDVGGTTGGVQLSLMQEYSELDVDQLVDVPARRMTKRDISLKTSMAEPTLENLAVALNVAGTVDSAISGIKKLSPPTASSAIQPSYAAAILDGFAPNQKRRRVVVRKVLSTAGAEFAYEKAGQTVMAVTLSAHYVSAAVKPFVILDEFPA
jgi:hypothetical protein